MNPALPSNLINPCFAELDEAASIEGVNFAQDSAFLFRCWQTYHVQSNFAGDISVPRSRNLFWRIWSNPHLRSVSNSEFNHLWQQCRGQLDLTPYRPNLRLWRELARPPTRPVSLQLPPKSLPSDRETLPTPESPRPARITFDEPNLNPPMRTTGRDRNTSGASGQAPSRPAYRRTGSGRTISSATTRGARSRPALPRRRSSQNRPTNQRASDSGFPQAATGEVTGCDPQANEERLGTRATATAFDLPSSWQSDDDDEIEEAQPPPLNRSESLVESNFRSKFVENQRQLTTGTSLPAATAMRKVRSSVRFADDTEDPTVSFKGKEVAREADPSTRDRSDSQVIAESDGSDEPEINELPRVHSQLSMLIKTKRQQSGSQDLGPSQPESDKVAEARKKAEELLRIGRQAAQPIIPRSRRGSRANIDSSFQSPSPNATF